MSRDVRFNLIGHDNGMGLTQDMRLLSGYLQTRGHEVVCTHWEAVSSPADVNVYLEFFHERHFESAPKHVGVFNLVFFDYNWVSFLPRFTQLWAKSVDAYDWYRSQGLTPILTGFLSRDLFEPNVEREQRVLHLRGQSPYKGTDAVLDAWAGNHSTLPPLTVVFTPPEGAVTVDPEPTSCGIPNVTVLCGYLSEARVRFETNRHRIHLCPSDTEGWGHYIAEALSCGAYVLTTDAPPMNEHVRSTYGSLLTVALRETKRIVTRHFVEASTIVEAVQRAAAQTDLFECGAAARRAWLERQNAFDQAVEAALIALH